MTDTEEKQVRPFWLLTCFAIITIIFWIITMCAPSLFWRFMDIILWIIFVLTGISAIINTFKNRKVQYIRFLLAFGILISILWFLLIFSRSQVIWTIIIWVFAIRAFLRWIILIFFGIANKKNQPFRRAILWLWILLFILWIVIMVSPKSEARTLAWICIWISTILDWVVLLIFSFRVKDNPSLQREIINQADQNEISQWNVVITKTTVVAQVESQPNTDNSQPIPEVQQPTPEVQQPTPEVQQPTPEVQQPTPEVQQPNNENPA